jgi:uncharacterized protein with ATP-grasp and redox domains
MEVQPDCFPCFLKQTLIALRLVTQDESLQKTVLQNILSDIQQADMSKPPAFTTTFIHRTIRTLLGRDPFHDIKCEYNRKALNLYPSLKEMVGKSPDPLRTSSRLAIGGNVIDFGIFATVDIEGTISRALNNSLAVDDYAAFRETITETDEILYLTDNAGEIVFDRILIETIMLLGKRVKAVVKGSPVINDSTREDAEETGLTQVCEVIDNGSDAVGTVLDWTSPDFRKTFKDAQLIISKGQANFETLLGSEKDIFFLFQSKCDVLSRELCLPTGSMLLMRS